MKFLPICLAAAAAAFAHAQYAGTAPVPEEYRRGLEAIRIEDAKSFLGYLAGPECEGRGTVQPGFQKAAHFMADHFKQFGLKPVGDKGTYFQIVHFARTTLDASSSTIMSRDGSKHYASPGQIAFGSLNRNVDVSSNTVWLKISDANAPLPGTPMEGRLVFVVASHFPAKLRTALAAKDPMAVIWVTDSVFQVDGNAQRPTAVNLSRISILQDVAEKMAADQGLPASLFDGK
ncbi:MAG TPA: hypothetical protein VG820_02975, partial [Fimbriimonadaceae bacterium]|nr:hypothetical protein [Fimbriimonadaceae bacterium]